MKNSDSDKNIQDFKGLKFIYKRMDKKKAQEKEKKRLLKYLYFLKHNHDWDYNFIFELLLFKIKMVRKSILKNNYTAKECLDKISVQMREVECLLEKVVKDEYTSVLEREFESKYTCKIKIKIKFKKDHRLISKRNFKGIDKDRLNEAEEEYGLISEKAFEMKKADLRKAFELMTENIWNWWD